MPRQSFKAAVLSLVHCLAAGAIYYHLSSGGWLTSSYRLDDPNVVNLALALFEPIAVTSMLIYWIRRTPRLYQLMWFLCLGQLAIGLGFVVFFLWFAFSWHPRLM